MTDEEFVLAAAAVSVIKREASVAEKSVFQSKSCMRSA